MTETVIPEPRRGGRFVPLLVLTGLALCALPAYAALFDGDRGVLQRDFGTIFLASIQEQAEAIRAGRLLIWDPLQFGGTPFWPLPNTAPAYPPLLLFILVFGALPGLNLCLFAHLLFGAFGMYLLVDRLTRQRAAAFLAGVVFLYSRYTQFLTDVLPLEVFASCWLPWAFLALTIAVTGRRVVPAAIAAGACFAAIPWCGGYVVLLRGFVLAGVWVGFASLRPPLVARAARGFAVLALMVLSFGLLAAGRLIPTLEWIPLTDRASGTAIELAMEGVMDGAAVREALSLEGAVPVALFVLAALFALIRLARRRFDWAQPLSMMALVLVFLCLGPLHQFLFEYVPGFGHIREPQRAWLLMPLVLSVGAGLGIARCLELAAGRARSAGVVVGVVALVALGIDRVVLRPLLRDERTSLSERMDRNALHRDLAGRLDQETPFRVHDYADTRPKMKRTADLIRTRLGLASIEGAIGNISIPKYDDDYLVPSRMRRANLWGAMNVRYVTSNNAIDEDGLTFLREFPRDPTPIHEGTDGPFLYRNEREVPRVYLVDHAYLHVGGSVGMWKWMLLQATWSPRKIALLRVDEGHVRLTPELLSWFDLVAAFPERDPGLDIPTAAEAGVPIILGEEQLAVQREVVADTLRAPEESLEEVTDATLEGNCHHIRLPDGAAERFLVLAETYAIYPGWRAFIDGVEAPLFQANGPGTALLVPRGAREVELRYTPPGLRLGLTISAVGALLLAAASFVSWRRGSREDAAAPSMR